MLSLDECRTKIWDSRVRGKGPYYSQHNNSQRVSVVASVHFLCLSRTTGRGNTAGSQIYIIHMVILHHNQGILSLENALLLKQICSLSRRGKENLSLPLRLLCMNCLLQLYTSQLLQLHIFLFVQLLLWLCVLCQFYTLPICQHIKELHVGLSSLLYMLFPFVISCFNERSVSGN